jgi:GTP cyclohydrolase IB
VTLEDVQATPDSRNLPLDEVGVSGLRYPVVVSDRDGAKQNTVADITMSVGLPGAVKGAHLSRFIEVFHQHAAEISPQTLPEIVSALRHRLDAPHARLCTRATYFRDRYAPVTGQRSIMGYEGVWTASADATATQVELGAQVPVTSVCPCSKAISDYGAHNQRGHITIQTRLAETDRCVESPLWIEDLIELAEGCASAPVYPLLKRPDERHVTMQAYDHPVFVEDMVRDAARQLRADARLTGFRVDVVNDESIHDHAAFASYEWPERGGFRDIARRQG